ncbi:MAG: DUF748 domain-containing protein [Flavobacteriales bacterium]|nr:DUF748 domain-containing protein [Flavobacteriales bacterium]
MKISSVHKYGKGKKILLISAAVLMGIMVLAIILISPIAKYLIQKYDQKYLGREITLDRVYLNPFTGYIHLSGLVVTEADPDSVFFKADGVSADFAMFKLLRKTYEISSITLDRPFGLITIDRKVLNFQDLIDRFTPKGPRDSTKAPVQFNILDIKIVDGEFLFIEDRVPVNYSVKNVNITSTGKFWDRDTLVAEFAFDSGLGRGHLHGATTIDLTDLDYRVAVVIEAFELDIINQYLQELTNYGHLSADVDADIRAYGNFKSTEDVTASGWLAINDFHFGAKEGDDFASFDKLHLAMREASPANHSYRIDSLALIHPFMMYERYDKLDNIQNMFGKKGANVKAAQADGQFNLILEIAKYVEVLAKNFLKSDYKVGRVAVYDADIRFNDYSGSEKFSVDLNPLFILADSIDKADKWMNLALWSGIRPYGDVRIDVSIDPKKEEKMDFDLTYHLQKVPVSAFNPYLMSFTSFPLDRGSIELKGKWHVRSGVIDSDNHLIILDPRVGKRVRNEDTKWIPMPLIMAFVRERGNVIDYEIPITGDLTGPSFNVWDAVGDLVTNIIVKPATLAYRMQVKNIEAEIERSITIRWPMRHSTLLSSQEDFMHQMADFLKQNPLAAITVEPQHYAIKEREHTLFYEAKKAYFLLKEKKDAANFDEDDMQTVDRMSMKDSLFVHFLNSQVNDSMLFTMEDKAERYLDTAMVQGGLSKLMAARKEVFMAFFVEQGVEKQVRFLKTVHVVPFNGFSHFKVDYDGDMPEKLRTAYSEMQNLNDESPRKAYKKKRKAIERKL